MKYKTKVLQFDVVKYIGRESIGHVFSEYPNWLSEELRNNNIVLGDDDCLYIKTLKDDRPLKENDYLLYVNGEIAFCDSIYLDLFFEEVKSPSLIKGTDFRDDIARESQDEYFGR